MEKVRVVGAGPAGGAAALAALGAGAEVEIYEKSRFPRHKVCGEFLSPQAAVVLERLGVWDRIQVEAAPMRRMVLTFGNRERRAELPEPAWGLSRRRLDELLLGVARERGAKFFREPGDVGPGSTVFATGRRAAAPKRGGRLFGFKAHFTGPASDAVELYFGDNGAYVGVSPVEGGRTNVCGIASEQDLARFGFDIDNFLRTNAVMERRLRPLRRAWDWICVGPVLFQAPDRAVGDGVYRCGDAMGFVDPFTGSGILSALLTGSLAGEAAARGTDVTRYTADCRRRLYPAYHAARLFRSALVNGWAQYVVPWVPLRLLFGLTRPRVW